MAGFSSTDAKDINFAPYVDTTGSDAMYRVGLIKQEDWEQGLQKVQGDISTVAGLPIAKSEIKDYIGTKINGIKDQITKNLAGDFSDERLTNQIGGAATDIYNDPIVQNGVTATASIQAGQAQMDADEKAGKLSPANQYAFQKPVSDWLGDGKANTKLNASYSTDWDIDGKIKGALDDAYKNGDIDENTWDEEVVGPDGKVDPRALIEKTSKGMSSAKVRYIINTITSQPGAQNQAQINANYLYQGMGPSQLLSNQTSSLKEYTDDYTAKKQALQVQWNAGNATQRQVIQSQIDDLAGEYKTIAGNYSDAKKSLVNPTDASVQNAKLQLYNSNLATRYANAYHWDVESKKIIDNPIFKAQMDINKYQLDQQKLAWDKQYQTAEIGIDQGKLAEEINKDQMESDDRLLALGFKKNKAGKLVAAGDPLIQVGDVNTKGVDAADVATYGADTYQKNLVQPLQDKQSLLQNELISQLTSGSTDKPLFKPDENGQLVPNIDPTGQTGYKTKDEILNSPLYKNALATLNKGSVDGTLPSNVQDQANDLYMTNKKLKVLTDRQAQIEAPLQQNITNLVTKLKTSGLPTQFYSGFDVNGYPLNEGNYKGYGGFKYTIDDVINAKLYNKFGDSDQNGKDAYSKLVKNLGQTNAEKLLNGGLGGGTNQNPSFIASNYIENQLNNSTGISTALNNRTTAYKSAQMGEERNEGTINTSTAERLNATNNEFSQVVANQASRSNSIQIMPESTAGKNTLLDWLDDSKKDNVTNNIYSTSTDDQGNTVWTVTRKGSTDKVSFKVDPADNANIQNLGTPEDPYLTDVKTFLHLNNNRTTIDKPMNSDAALASSIPLPQGRNIGNYAVGYQLEKNGVDDRYLIHMYITNNNTGQVVAKGLRFIPTPSIDNPHPVGAFPLENLQKTLLSIDANTIDEVLKKNGLK